MPTRRTIKTDYLARVEGEGAMSRPRSWTAGSSDVELRIFEPPRFFEALLRGRSFLEAPDITARICGICPVAYQMSAVNAMEDALRRRGRASRSRLLRRLLYCGEWIESHALHVYMLHAPDFLGYAGAVEMARDHRDVVERGPGAEEGRQRDDDRLGGREIHPVNVRVGGFYRAPSRRELRDARRAARAGARGRARDGALDGRLRVPGAASVDCEFVALAEPGEYPIERGRIVSDRGLDIAPPSTTSTSSRSTSSARTRCIRRRTDGGDVPRAARSRATRSTPTGCRRSRARPPREAGLGDAVPQRRSAASSSAASSSSTPATRRCG